METIEFDNPKNVNVQRLKLDEFRKLLEKKGIKLMGFFATNYKDFKDPTMTEMVINMEVILENPEIEFGVLKNE